jgi:hypothetical protein
MGICPHILTRICHIVPHVGRTRLEKPGMIAARFDRFAAPQFDHLLQVATNG